MLLIGLVNIQNINIYWIKGASMKKINYLKENAAIEPGVMKHTGRGEYMPVADNATPEGRAKNRRVEIKIYNALSAY